MMNPLLDTINAVNSCSDSSDECDINSKCYTRSERRHRRPVNGNTCNYYYSSSDGDSISSYAATNSLESGYKSDYLGCNTPEQMEDIPDSITEAITHQMSGNESSPTDDRYDRSMGLDVSEDCVPKNDLQRHQKHAFDDMNSNCGDTPLVINNKCGFGRKTGGILTEKMANRLKSLNTDSQLDHLFKLRKSLLKALRRCERISTPVNSRDGSPITAPTKSVSSRSSSPASTVIRNFYTNNNSINTRRIRGEHDINSSDKCRQKFVSSPVTIRSQDGMIDTCDEQLSDIESVNTDCPFNDSSVVVNNGCKSVRFNSSVKFSPNSMQMRRKEQISGNYVSNKSILKDPLCETLRSAIKAGEFTNSCSLEGEIDELLYGRTGAYYHSPSHQSKEAQLADDLMCPSQAYVARLEEKYRTLTNNDIPKNGYTTKHNTTNTTSAVVSKKKANNSNKEYSSLKTGFSSSMSSKALEQEVDLSITSEPRVNTTLSSTTTTASNHTNCLSSYSSLYGTTTTPHSTTNTNNQTNRSFSAKSNRKSKKKHLNEMAKCMLEILNDLQVPNNATDIYSSATSSRLQNTIFSTDSDNESNIDLLMKELSIGQSDTSDLSDISSTSYRTFPEQHIYEEILYDCLESQPNDVTLYQHYLPSHRTITSSANKFTHSSVNGIRVEAPIQQSHIRHVGSWGRTSNRPKQRSNLYTIFSDESERRNISRSLEREFCKRNAFDINTNINNNTNLSNSIESVLDNYGFKI